MNVRALIFDTNYIAEMKKAKLEEGFLKIGNMQIPVDKSRHFTLKRKIFHLFTTTVPLFILKWNSIYPMEFEVAESKEATYVDESGREITLYRKELVPADIEFYEEKKKIYPELVKDVTEIKFLKRMKSYLEPRGRGELPILPLLLALILGAVIMYFLITSKLIVVR